MDLELVIFDCDGVLVDSERISNEVLARALATEGLALSTSEARGEFQGLLLADIRARAQALLGRRLPEDWLARYERDRDAAFRRELVAVAGARRAVELVKQAGIAVCVASQGRLEKTRLTLGLTGLLDLFADDALFSAYAVPRGKPHPDLFLSAAATMGVAPARCVVVEDSASGVTAAVSAQMRALGYAADADAAALLAAGAELIDSLDELSARLEIV